MKGFLRVMFALSAVALAAQSHAPAGWVFRADNSTSASDPDAPGDIKFVTSGRGFHATNPRAAVYWNRADTIRGAYTLRGTFTLLAPSNHTNYYGLVFGGTDLGGPKQQYVYFLVAQDGTWLVKRRDGDATTQTIFPKTASPAVRTPDAAGRSVNALEVRIVGPSIDFIVNGAVVDRWTGASLAVRTDGTYGIRVNHFLDVQIDDLVAAPLSGRTGSATTATPPAPETVAITAAVDRMLSPAAFTMKAAGDAAPEALVVAPALQRAIEGNSVATAFGRMVPLDTIESGKNLELPPGVERTYRGRPVLTATTVLDAKMVDLTKPLPPPITPDEEALGRLMNRIAPAFAALRQSIDASAGAATSQHAATLQQAFADVEAVWTSRGRSDASTWARTAREQAEAIARDGAGGKWDGVKSSMTVLAQQCQSCHSAYREQFANGEFRIKRTNR